MRGSDIGRPLWYEAAQIQGHNFPVSKIQASLLGLRFVWKIVSLFAKQPNVREKTFFHIYELFNQIECLRSGGVLREVFGSW
jgi:hypothetical protein